MRAFGWAAALVLALSEVEGLLAPQEQADTVRDLVEKLDSEDIAVADDAAGALTRLGVPALPLLRAEAKKRQGELRRRIEDVVRRVERSEKLVRALGAPPRVTLRAKDRPVGEILAELSRQSGVRVEAEGLPDDARASLAADGALVWNAVDDLCRAHGGLMYLFTPKRLLVRAAPYRTLPRTSDRGFFFFLDSFSWTKIPGPGTDSYFEVHAALARPPRSALYDAVLVVEAFEDDKGTNLLAPPAGEFTLEEPTQDDPETLAVPLYLYPPVPPSEAAQKIARMKGRVSMRAVLEFRPALTIRAPLAQPATRVQTGRSRLEIHSVKRNGADVRVHVSASFPEAKDAPGRGLRRVVLRDSRGEALPGRYDEELVLTGQTFVIEEEDSGLGSFDETLTFTVPEGTEVTAIELLLPSDVETVSIPFEFKDIPLR